MVRPSTAMSHEVSCTAAFLGPLLMLSHGHIWKSACYDNLWQIGDLEAAEENETNSFTRSAIYWGSESFLSLVFVLQHF